MRFQDKVVYLETKKKEENSVILMNDGISNPKQFYMMTDRHNYQTIKARMPQFEAL